MMRPYATTGIVVDSRRFPFGLRLPVLPSPPANGRRRFGRYRRDEDSAPSAVSTSYTSRNLKVWLPLPPHRWEHDGRCCPHEYHGASRTASSHVGNEETNDALRTENV